MNTNKLTLKNYPETILNNDVLSIIDDYKTSMEKFEEHQILTKNIRNEVCRFFNLIKNSENKSIITINTGNFILSWIENEKTYKYQEQFHHKLLEIDYGEDSF